MLLCEYHQTASMNQILDEHTRIIHQAQDYIERHLNQPLTVDELAKVTHLSPFYFHRLFSYVTLEPLHGYIKRNRLERAAFLLRADLSKNITEIALEVGFSNQSSFAKAFKLEYGISASQYRSGDAVIEHDRRHLSRTLAMVDPLFISIEDHAQRNVAYVRHTGQYKGNSELFGALFTKLDNWIRKHHINIENANLYCLYHDKSDQTIDDKLRLSVCVDVDAHVRPSGEISIMTLDGGKYAAGRFILSSQEYQGAWNAMLFKWLPGSGYIFDDRLPFERYVRDVAGAAKDQQVVDICIPIRRSTS